MDDEDNALDEDDLAAEGEDCSDTAMRALNRADMALERVDRVLKEDQPISRTASALPEDQLRPQPFSRSVTDPARNSSNALFRAFGYLSGPHYSHSQISFEPEDRRLLEWLSQVGSDIPSDIAPSSSCSWPSRFSARSLEVSL